MTRGQIFIPLAVATLLLGGCATSDPYYTKRDPHVYGSRKEKVTTGIALGAISGGIIGNNTGLGTVGGASIGGVLGGILGDTASRNNSSSYSTRSVSSGSLGYRRY